MHLRLLPAVLLAALSGPILQAQSLLPQARADVAALCADSLHGRGYVQDGHLKAARYIGQRFARLGVRPVQPLGAKRTPQPAQPEAYFQRFTLKVVVPDTAALVVGPRSLGCGTAFVPAGYSAAGLADAPLMALQPGKLDGLRNRIAVMPAGPVPDSLRDEPGKPHPLDDDQVKAAFAHKAGALGLLLLVPKLTHTYAPQPAVPDFPVLMVHTDSLKGVALNGTQKAHLLVRALQRNLSTQNVLGFVRGTRTDTGAIVLGAHYDHLGRVGPALFAGANDNASGVALLLSLADALARQPLPVPVVFVAFGAEEAGLVGARHYVANPALPLPHTRAMLNFDLFGFGEEGVMAVNGNENPEWMQQLRHLADSLQLNLELKTRPNRPNSDHFPFTEQQVPALFFYAMGGLPHYHDVFDRPEGLTYAAFEPMHRLVLAWLRKFAR